MISVLIDESIVDCFTWALWRQGKLARCCTSFVSAVQVSSMLCLVTAGHQNPQHSSIIASLCAAVSPACFLPVFAVAFAPSSEVFLCSTGTGSGS